MSRPLIAILAGGASTRMGEDKALVDVAGKPMAQWVIEAASQVGEPLVVGRRGFLLGTPAAIDIISARRGPAAGLATALARNGGPVVLVGCDQPWVRPATLEGLLDRANGSPVIPLDGGHPQVTCAVYPPGLARAMAAAARRNASIRSVLDVTPVDEVTDWQTWGEDGRSWFSVDDAAALQTGLARFGPPSD